jgi:GntR family transcriptional regulator, transcriptional repressor for pyruvate dehydrogenase complex
MAVVILPTEESGMTNSAPARQAFRRIGPGSDGRITEQILTQVRDLIARGELRPGDRLPPERDLAVNLGVSRPSVRAALKSLISMGVLRARRGSGTYVTDGPPELVSEPLTLLAALHGFTLNEIFEARRSLEAMLAGMAAERATGDQLVEMAEELANMYATLADPPQFLLHDIRFHKAIARASGNPVLATVAEMVSAMHYERRSETIGRASGLEETAADHRRIFQAIRGGSPDAARQAMAEHILRAQRTFAAEEHAVRAPGGPTTEVGRGGRRPGGPTGGCT